MSANRRNAKSGTKALITLRKVLQDSINQEIHAIMEKYIQTYIAPAVELVEKNQEDPNLPAQQCIKFTCRQILDEAKKMY